MAYLVLGIVLLLILLVFGRAFVNANPASLANQIRIAGGILLLAAAAGLALTGRWVLALPVGGFALSLLGLRKIAGFSPAGRGRSGKGAAAGQASAVRSRFIEMRLDHDSGDMDGMVLEGKFKGQTLDALAPGSLKELWEEARGDSDSLALLEAYLDRRLAGWREDFQADTANRQGGAPGSGAMSKEEAYEILGLADGAGEAEIRAAHRRLMKRLHPDSGGTAFLAAKLNEAKDVLLRRH
ncbi:DnaJ domain-containing protein [Stappia sp. GBMRC 2046]|uniref:DnaJ domain-containing protein n=1 Tax=Stappia sediminis TaxID=2692190 RepID=A0A7X3S6R4_9HYPH|nr:DnaJ domain-containing protein [Stappia sediminis]MXN64138.1 DnaJ domain-containing protein [Stappia sediminis]